MTHIFFVRHAQPDESWKDDRTRPLTETGLADRKRVTELLAKMHIDCFYSSPYKRAMDTISECAGILNKEIYLDERFRERQPGEIGNVDFMDLLHKKRIYVIHRWSS